MLTWNENLSVNVIEIDDQHKDMFDKINNFLEAIERGTDEPTFKELMVFLEQYIVFHFDYEEKIMAKYNIHGYPDEMRHKSEHKAFKRDFKEFKTDLTATNISRQFKDEFRILICNWWLIHINKMDKGLGEFIRQVILL